ncbi:MAG: hypothetical protein S4CHLAM45_05670 [Chlamydiales bacterium]|nr:hypothetical protein [Chlamydiales bacterium]MCH9619892.1 hypothetical protein [Chlamydiales bacterium]MCH9622681.1 hypothetical protein [Chlamydiales bacterium]
MKSIKDKKVKNKFDSYPEPFKTKLLKIRELIFQTAEEISSAGPLKETLKWGEPSYLTVKTKSGSTIRIDWKKSNPKVYAIYFNCRTTLIGQFKAKFGSLFTYEGNRAIIFSEKDPLPEAELRDCFAIALTYHIH